MLFANANAVVSSRKDPELYVDEVRKDARLLFFKALPGDQAALPK
jgi:hypothetical protein